MEYEDIIFKTELSELTDKMRDKIGLIQSASASLSSDIKHNNALCKYISVHSAEYVTMVERYRVLTKQLEK